jgi:hypothetical protein
MSEERILLKLIVRQRVVKQGEDSRFEGEVVACFVTRNLKTARYVIENDDGVLHIASERQLRLAMPNRPAQEPADRLAIGGRVRIIQSAAEFARGETMKPRAQACVVSMAAIDPRAKAEPDAYKPTCGQWRRFRETA